MTRDPGGFRAQFDGHCAICGDWFPRYTLIVKRRGEPCHVDCYTREHQ